MCRDSLTLKEADLLFFFFFQVARLESIISKKCTINFEWKESLH